MEFCVNSRCNGVKHSLYSHLHCGEALHSSSQSGRPRVAQYRDKFLGCHGKQRQHRLSSNAIAEPDSKSRIRQQDLDIEVDNDAEESSTVIKVSGLNKPGLLSALTKKMQNLGLEVVKVASWTQYH